MATGWPRPVRTGPSSFGTRDPGPRERRGSWQWNVRRMGCDTLMQRIAEGILVLMLNLWVVAGVSNAQDKAATPAEQYQALRKEYDRASNSGVPLTDAERLKFVGRAYQHRNALAQKFLELA